jgi:hypothetical protein
MLTVPSLSLIVDDIAAPSILLLSYRVEFRKVWGKGINLPDEHFSVFYGGEGGDLHAISKTVRVL